MKIMFAIVLTAVSLATTAAVIPAATADAPIVLACEMTAPHS